MNFTPNIASFATGTYTVTRRGPTTVGADGRVDLASSSTLSILASVQPLGGRDLERLPEGLRVGERRKMYTGTVLKVSDTPDVVAIDGADWEVETCLDYQVLGAYSKYLIRKVGS